mmetsp:Transcript_81972/g.219304  ORF Transcript_81972/g.219304 Transcript_81972/m.219304 type:complete len:467 (-) Transcript_81972:143-1543(-)
MGHRHHEYDEYYGVFVPAVVAPAAMAFISSICSLWLLFSLRKLLVVQEEPELMLFPRQLWTLAVADLICSVFVFAWCMIGGELPPVTQDHDWDHIVTFGDSTGCKVVHFGLRVGECSSALMAAHLAVGVAASNPRCACVLRALCRSICFVWPVSVALALRDTNLTVWEYSSKGLHHRARCRPGNLVYFDSINLETGTFLLSTAVLVVAYIASVVRVFFWDQATFVSRRRAWSRFMTYPFLAICTLGPTVVYHLVPSLELSQDARLLAFVALGSNGFCNALAYMVHSINGRKIRRRLSGGSNGSFMASNGEISPCPSSTDLLRKFGSFDVTIGGAQVFLVPANQRDAMRLSESETDMLAAMKEPLRAVECNQVAECSESPAGTASTSHPDDDMDDDDEESASLVVPDERRLNRRRHVQAILLRQEWRRLVWRSLLLLICGVGGPVALMYGLSSIPQPHGWNKADYVG